MQRVGFASLCHIPRCVFLSGFAGCIKRQKISIISRAATLAPQIRLSVYVSVWMSVCECACKAISLGMRVWVEHRLLFQQQQQPQQHVWATFLLLAMKLFGCMRHVAQMQPPAHKKEAAHTGIRTICINAQQLRFSWFQISSNASAVAASSSGERRAE